MIKSEYSQCVLLHCKIKTKTKFSPGKMGEVIYTFGFEALNAEPNSKINKLAIMIVKEICTMASFDNHEYLLQLCFDDSA